MSRKRPHPGPTPGVYPIDTGTVELLADDSRHASWLINVNGVPSSHLHLDDPRLLDFEYMRWITAIVENVVDDRLDSGHLRITHLGGAAGALAVYFADVYPASRNTVVEIDGELARLVREWFDLPRAPKVKFRIGEAFAVTSAFRPASRDVIIRDAFAGDSTPEPLTTVEFFAAARAALIPGGLYVANCGDRPDLTGARAELAGMAEVFPHLAVIADPPMLKGRRRGNIILIGSDGPLPEDGSLARRLLAGGVPAQYHAGRWVQRFHSGAIPRSLSSLTSLD